MKSDKLAVAKTSKREFFDHIENSCRDQSK